MATIVLGALGTLIGGPIGGAIGALAGRHLDSAIIGSPSGREGPRLKDLSITTSSYGAPLPRIFGKMRVAGSIIWATELIEHSETSGGGKGKPRTTSYSYTASFAVALSSRPIESIGRIWADGNLLRGAAGDLKTGGTMRIYHGHGNQPVDPLIAAAQGTQCPAFRDCAYVIFENLQLEDFGNRIPALTFEVRADPQMPDLSELIEPLNGQATSTIPLAQMKGFSIDQGTLADSIAVLDQFIPMAVDGSRSPIAIESTESAQADPPLLPMPSLAGLDADDDTPQRSGHSQHRKGEIATPPEGIRYYDIDRDYQPGVQRRDRPSADSSAALVDLPAAMTASQARSLATRTADRAGWLRNQRRWQLGELNPQLSPGTQVRVPDDSNRWLIEEWEWNEAGVELLLSQLPPVLASLDAGDPGTFPLPIDEDWSRTILRSFELPWDGIGPVSGRRVYSAVSGDGSRWAGASMFANGAAGLSPIGTSGRNSAVQGQLSQPVDGSTATRFEPAASMEIELHAREMVLASTDIAGIAQGSNRMLVGDEILQFANADRIGPTAWKLTGLLRGRGGTEIGASHGHQAGTKATLLDSRLTEIDISALEDSGAQSIAAIGRGDTEPIGAEIENAGSSMQPLSPVHARVMFSTTGDLEATWCRRARGAWRWMDGIDTPLVEESELYRVGIGPIEQPLHFWEVTRPEITVPGNLVSANPGETLWVRQIGSQGQSYALQLAVL